MAYTLIRRGKVLSKFFFSIFLLGLLSCAGVEDQYGQVKLIHGRPVLPRMIPRQVLGALPSGPFQSQEAKGIIIMDSGADYGGETALTYLTNALRRYRTADGNGDLPFHFYLDPEGKIFAGRQVMIPAQLHEGDSFTQRTANASQKEDLLVQRLARLTKPALNLKGYITIVLLGDYDKILVIKEQEKSLFQLVSYLCFQYFLPRESIIGIENLYPEVKNPGFYLKNYLNASILEKNIPLPPQTPHLMRIPGKDG